MDKQIYIDKIALISEELQLLSSNWIRKDYKIDALEVETYLSNIRYLTEQANILRQLLETQTEQKPSVSDVHVHMSSIPVRKAPVEFPTEEVKPEPIPVQVIETPTPVAHTPEIAAEEFDSEMSLHEKLSSQMKSSSLADSLKNSFFQKEITFSFNDRFYFINELFNADQKDFEKVIAHLTTLDSWEEVEFYLNATCVVPYEWETKEEPRTKFYEFLQSRFN